MSKLTRGVAILLGLALAVLGVPQVWSQIGPRTNGANILVRTDANGYVLASSQTYTGPDGPLRNFANTLVRTDANGYLTITNPSGFGGAPTDAGYWVDQANATLTAERNLGALTTGLVLNTVTASVGVPSAYAGTSCTNQFPRSLNASGAATCATVALADTTGIAPADAGYWVDTANGTLSAERNLGGLTTGLVLNTVTAGVGVPSAYAGTSCTNQFPRSLNASAAATCASVSLTADITGALAATNGGTGQTAVATGDVLYGSATDTWSRLSAGLAGRYLRGGGAGTAPAWSTLILPNAATANRLVYATATNTYGEDASLTYNGSLLDISSGQQTGTVLMGADVDATSRTNATRKLARLVAKHYTNAEENIAVFLLDSQASNTFLTIGGGGSALNTVTEIRLITATNTTTLDGTERLRITTNGHMMLPELTTDPGTGDLAANAAMAVYNKNNKIVFAYNNAGTITYVTLDMDGSDITWAHSTTAP